MVDKNEEIANENAKEQDEKNQGFVGSLLDKGAAFIAEYPSVVRIGAAVLTAVAGVVTAGVGAAVAGAALAVGSEGLIKIAKDRNDATIERRKSLREPKEGGPKALEQGLAQEVVRQQEGSPVVEKKQNHDGVNPSSAVKNPVAMPLDHESQKGIEV